MPKSASPRQILATLLPYLKTAGDYADQIQARISEQPDKTEMPNFFAAALSDADLSVQTFVEVVLLAHFPGIRFFGEEHEKTYNTKYFSSIELGNADDDYLVTLDPIDGTRFYLDNHPNFQIIFTVMTHQGYEGVIALSPAKQEYFYAIKGEGTHWGDWHSDLDDCSKLTMAETSERPTILLGFAMQSWAESLSGEFDLIKVAEDYSATVMIPNVNGILTGDLSGAVLAKGNWIDGGAIAFLVQEAGGVVTDLEGNPLPLMDECKDRMFSGLMIATSLEIQTAILNNRPQF
jgi:myo-inositol-1(or 4)-monophosphatase